MNARSCIWAIGFFSIQDSSMGFNKLMVHSVILGCMGADFSARVMGTHFTARPISPALLCQRWMSPRPRIDQSALYVYYLAPLSQGVASPSTDQRALADTFRWMQGF